MKKEELYKVTDILNDVLSNYLRGSEAEEVIAKLEESVEDSELIKEEPASEIDFEQELYKYFGQVKDFTLGMRIAKRFYDIGRNYQKPVSEDLEQAIDTYLATYFGGEKEKQDWPFLKKMAIYFAELQKEQLLAKAIDGTFSTGEFADGTPIDAIFNFDKVVRNKYEEGEKVKLIVIKK